MKFSISWLKEHLDTNASVDEIQKTLTKIGLEVEEVINPAENLHGFVVGEVISCEMHPDSDHLHLLKVFDGKQELQVVCGAPNVKMGLKSIFAPVGTLIPCYNEVLKVGKIRGVESFGMLCSEKELGIGEDHTGIIELPATVNAGDLAENVLSVDPVIEISITPNRAECLGVRGIARDLAAAGMGTLKPLNIKHTRGTFKSPIDVKVEANDVCPVYVGRYIKGVNNKAVTPKWMKDRLLAIGLRPISPLVDITNYINYDMARPLHVFDADKLSGNICVRMAKNGEKFVSLEEKEYLLDDKSLGICDDQGIQCLGGIMGGLEKGCYDDTTNVFLECALFIPENIARTGRKYQIDSDSRYRYERWVDPKSNILGSDYATQLILDICGGEASEQVIVGAEPDMQKIAYIRPERLKTFIGMEVSKEKIIEILQKLGFVTTDEGTKIKAISPSWRGDIEGEHDLVEEVVRMIGLDEIPLIPMETDTFPKQTLTPKQNRVVAVKHNLASRGMFETITWSFTDSKIAKLFNRDNHNPVLLINPIAAEMDEMRPSLLPNLLLAAKNNIAKGYPNCPIFEVSSEFFGPNPNEQRLVACGIRTGNTEKKNWVGEVRQYDVFDVKADAIAVIAAANGPYDNLQITCDAPEYYHPGRSGTLRLGKNVLAYFGEIHPSINKNMGIKQKVEAFEVFLDNIPEPRSNISKTRKKLEIYSLQSIDKDMAFIVDNSVSAIDVISTAKNADRNFITDVRLFDVYSGDNLPDGKKSLALSVTFQPKEKTFSDEEIETLMNKIKVAINQKFGGILRDA